MNLRAIKTHRVRARELRVDDFINKFVPPIVERDIVAVSTKVLSLCMGLVSQNRDKAQLVAMNAQYYLDADKSQYGQMLTIAHDTLLVAAGIDESNTDSEYALLPENLGELAMTIRQLLRERDGVQELGVLLVDSASRPLRVGTVGTCLASAGIRAVKDYRNTTDVFERLIVHSQANHTEALAAISVALMGEGDEQTPIVVITDAPFVEFIDLDGGTGSVKTMQDDLFAPILTAVDWQKGRAESD